MRLCFGVHRYGVDVGGGAETLCRLLAERLTARGHEVHVVTSRARSYVTWADEYPEGMQEINGVTVHRLSVSGPRRDEEFGPLNARVVWGNQRAPWSLQQRWLRSQGPDLPGLVPWLHRHLPSFDAALFVTYLYATTVDAMPSAAALVPTVLQPTAHDEPPFYLQVFDSAFRHATALAYLTPEEEALVLARAPVQRPSAVTGIGIDLEQEGDGQRFRRIHGLGDRPVLLFLGRVDPGKGSDEVVDFFRAYKQRNRGPLTLVIVGDPVTRPDTADDVVVTGYVDDQTRLDALAAATVFVQPSYFESFSMALCEAWVHAKPALVQGRCDVLAGQALRSGGGIAYHGFAEFEAALQLLLDDPRLAARIGGAGARYVEANYRWDVVLDRYERLFTAAVEAHARTSAE